jgi:hypothetical protein
MFNRDDLKTLARRGAAASVTDDRAPCRGEQDSDDADLIRTAGEERGANQNSFTRKWHACTFKRDDAEYDPGAIDWDQAD